jgi:HEAT repeat protein
MNCIRPITILLILLVAVISGCTGIRTAGDVEGVRLKAESGDQEAVDELINSLRSDDKEVREASYAALSSVGKKAVPSLIIVLKDPSPDMREYAAGALGNIGDQRAVLPLVEMLRSDTERRYVAAWALVEIKATSAAGLLIEMLSVDNDALQKESTRALIKIGDGSVNALNYALTSPNSDTRKFAARALGVIQDKRAEKPLIRALSDTDKDVTAAAALALGTAGTNDSIGPLMDALDHDSFMTRINASISLGQLEATDAVSKLESIMDDDDDPYVREWSARALENITGNRYKYKNENGDMVYPYNLYR